MKKLFTTKHLKNLPANYGLITEPDFDPEELKEKANKVRFAHIKAFRGRHHLYGFHKPISKILSIKKDDNQ